jgi:5-methyltetrahydrofolate--homocysteine methyltransferase
MVYVAKEMEKSGLKLPILIGGATTSKMHTAVKIAPEYSSTCIYVPDASRAVTVVSQLLNPKKSKDYIDDIKEEYNELRILHKESLKELKFLPLKEVREKKLQLKKIEKKPSFLGNFFYVKKY